MITFVPEPAGAETFYSAILFRNRSPEEQKRAHAVGTRFRNTPQPFSYVPVRWRAILDRKWRDQTEERSDPFCPGQNEQDLPVQIGREPHFAFVTGRRAWQFSSLWLLSLRICNQGAYRDAPWDVYGTRTWDAYGTRTWTRDAYGTRTSGTRTGRVQGRVRDCIKIMHGTRTGTHTGRVPFSVGT